MTRLEIDWPDASVERARAARGRIERSAAALADMSLDERLAAIARVVDDWARPDSPWRRELADTLAHVTSFSPGTVREGLDSALRAWRSDRLVRCARRELASAIGNGDRALVPFGWTCVLGGGSIPMPTILTALLPLALGSPVLLRETRKDPVSGELIARSLHAQDERLGRAFASLACAPDDDAALDVLLEAPCVVATGADETMHSIAGRLGAQQRLVAYGHHFSIAVLGATAADDTRRLEASARGIALDVARWDQLGCLSPVVTYLVGQSARQRVSVAEAIDRALGALAERMPRGNLPADARAGHATERAEARMRAATGATRLYEARGHTIVLEADARARPAPLHRFLRLLPVDSTARLLQALRPFEGRISAASVDGLPEGDGPGVRALHEGLWQLGVSRIADPGSLQTPPIDWPRDGLPLFTPLARFAQSTSDRSTEISS